MDDGKLSVAVSDQRREFIEEELAAGTYADEAEIVDAALELLESSKKLGVLRALIAEGDTDIAAGRVHRYDSAEDFLADIRREGDAN
jgi:putative addiction module CopG family antidote